MVETPVDMLPTDRVKMCVLLSTTDDTEYALYSTPREVWRRFDTIDMNDGVGRKFIEETPDDEGNVKERFHGSIGCVMSSYTVRRKFHFTHVRACAARA